MLPIFTYRKDGYWFACVSNEHFLAGSKCMALTKRKAIRLLREALEGFSVEPDAAPHPIARLGAIAKLVAEFGASAA